VVFGSVENVTWATAAADAHNAYLNMAITTGIPGLALVILLVVVLPLIDYQKGADDDASRALSTLFMRIWLFGVYVSCFESIIFPQGGRLETWFVMLVAIFGLRYLTLSRARP
jgi:O-antigen ligase